MKTAEELYDFLNATPLMVISTINADGTPEAAVVGFGQTKDLQILIGTNKTTRKYQNLMRDPHVALVIGWDKGQTVQMQGEARELGEHELDIVRDNYWVKNPHAQKHAANPDERNFIITPTWIRFTDVTTQPWDIEATEIKL